jgi:hypothetical protein
VSKNKSANEFTILDWIGVVYTVGNIISLFTLPKAAVVFRDMYADFGGSVPQLTNIVTKPWVPILTALICICIFSLQWVKWFKVRLKRRRAVVVFSFLIASTAFAVCVIGYYLPIFKMARSLG